jgi:hypothetical protein
MARARRVLKAAQFLGRILNQTTKAIGNNNRKAGELSKAVTNKRRPALKPAAPKSKTPAQRQAEARARIAREEARKAQQAAKTNNARRQATAQELREHDRQRRLGNVDQFGTVVPPHSGRQTATSKTNPGYNQDPVPRRTSSAITRNNNAPDPFRTDYSAIAPRTKGAKASEKTPTPNRTPAAPARSTASPAARSTKPAAKPAAKPASSPRPRTSDKNPTGKLTDNPIGTVVGAGAAGTVLYQMLQNLGKTNGRDAGNDGASLPKNRGKATPDLKTASLEYLEARRRKYG